MTFARHKVCEVIKILGVYFGYDLKQRHDLNFTETLKAIKKSINLWKWRSLSLLGRIQIVKTFSIPKLMYRSSVIALPKSLAKEVNSILYGFVWNWRDNCVQIVDKSSVQINIPFLATSVAKIKRKSRTNTVRCEFHCLPLPLT